LFQQRIAEIPESKRDAWRYHRVAPDDSLAAVARSYRVPVPDLAAANQLGENDSIAGIEALIVPVAPVAASSARTLLYTTRKGDTLVSIADRFGVSLNQLRRWNKINGVKVQPGRRLHVAEPANVVRASTTHRRGSSTSKPATKNEEADPPVAAHHSARSAKSGRGGVTSSKRTRTEKPATAASTQKSRNHKRSSHRNSSTRKQK
jgi:membrane-bound lytic murein transglycosylase D